MNNKQTLLNWWPFKLAGDENEGQIFVDVLHDSLWSVKNNDEWSKWCDQVEKIWPKLQFIQPIFSSPKNNDGIDIHLGPSLGEAIHSIDNKNSLFWKKQKDNHKQTNILTDERKADLQEIEQLAEKLKQDFNLFEVVASSASSSKWIKKQLIDAYMGLSNLSLLMGIDKKRIGLGTLRLWFYENSYLNGAVNSNGDHIEIHRKCGNFGHAWSYWRLNSQKDIHDRVYFYTRKWRMGWGNSQRNQLEHMFEFFDKFKLALKYQLDQVPVTSEMGQRSFRRYRAACKWIDDILRGNNLQAIYDSWVKLKTGNKIAWSGEHAKGFEEITKNWAWEEKLIDFFFWDKNNWITPSWVKRGVALNNHEVKWDLEVEQMESVDVILLWAMGIEAMFKQELEYDSWLAKQHISYPKGHEANNFKIFFEENLKELIK